MAGGPLKRDFGLSGAVLLAGQSLPAAADVPILNFAKEHEIWNGPPGSTSLRGYSKGSNCGDLTPSAASAAPSVRSIWNWGRLSSLTI
jgi:hypothetical protein